ncbi:uncharacterized protein LOC143913685 [Arctopsyche grandis]|uniref:uncharacterized protein LOC143913685 n=1 Tax=Arctopsyche grandis TaxID=121162 RepID=UPI00406D7DAF
MAENTICRCCQSNTYSFLKPLSSRHRKLLFSCTQLTVFEDDHLPPFICVNCLNTLKISHNFKKKCELSYAFLMKNCKRVQTESNTDVKDEIIDFSTESHVFENNYSTSELSNEISDNEAVMPKNNDPVAMIEDEKANEEKSEIFPKNESQYNKKIRIDTKKHGYFITSEQNNFDLEPEYLEALYKIYKHRCNHCSRMYAVESHFRVHVNNHLGIRPYFCEICKKHFSDERSHVKYHKQRKEKGSFKCQYCERAYNCAGSLRTHMKVHTGDMKWFACSQCSKKFNQINKLNNHMVVHTSDRNFICQYCSKAFRFNRNLRAHIMSIHVRNRSHVCDTCTKAFSTAHELTLHKRRHLGIKNHHCTLCTLSFVSSSELQSHMSSIHTKTKKFPCRNCGARFSRSTHRNNHEGSKRCISNMSKNINNPVELSISSESGRCLDDFMSQRDLQTKDESLEENVDKNVDS